MKEMGREEKDVVERMGCSEREERTGKKTDSKLRKGPKGKIRN